MPFTLSKYLIFLFLFCLFFNACYSSQNLFKQEARSKMKIFLEEKEEENFLKIPLKKLEMSDAHKKKFYDFISESQSDLYTNFLVKSKAKNDKKTMKKISLINFQNIQVNLDLIIAK